MNTLKFTVMENGKLFSASQMTEPECYGIEAEVNRLLPSAKGDYWFEVQTSNLDCEDDEEPDYMQVSCYKVNPTPADGSELESKIPAPLPKELLDALAGKTIQIQPTQYGLSPWGEKVEVVFEERR